MIITCFDGNSMANLIFVNIRDASDGGIQCRPHDFIWTELQFSFARWFIKYKCPKIYYPYTIGYMQRKAYVQNLVFVS